MVQALNKVVHKECKHGQKRIKIKNSHFAKLCKYHFEADGTQNYLVFQPINRYFKVLANTLYISSWKSKGLSDETIKPPVTSDNILTPLIDCLGNTIRQNLEEAV